VLAVASAIVAVPAFAAPIGGATYTGVAADGAQVTFTVSPDGTLVDSYRFDGVFGNDCMFFGEGDQGVWQGAPIHNNAFTYSLGSAMSFAGAFSGKQSVSGTFQMHQDAIENRPACDTWSVNWTASTTATPGGSGGGGNGGGGHGGTLAIATRVSLRRGSAKLLGALHSSSKACLVSRTVILWRGSRRMGHTSSRAGGKFYFARKASLRGSHVRASVLARTVRGGLCSAGSSTFIRG
jgi:hypothetical protein